MNKKQFIFYVFILTFGIACGDGSVKESEDTTNTPKVDNLHKEDKLPKVGNPPIGDKPIKVSQPSNYDNAINYDFTKEIDIYFLKDLKYKLEDMEEKMNDAKMDKKLDDAEENMILETYKAFMILIMQQVENTGEAVAKGSFRPMVEYIKSLQKWLKNIDSFSYDNAINYDWTQETEERFFREYKEGEMNMKEAIETFKMKKQLDDREEKIMLETDQVFMVLIITPFKKFEEAFQEGKYRPMVKWAEKLQPMLKKF